MCRFNKDEPIAGQIISLYTHGNTLIKNFSNCSDDVKWQFLNIARQVACHWEVGFNMNYHKPFFENCLKKQVACHWRWPFWQV